VSGTGKSRTLSEIKKPDFLVADSENPVIKTLILLSGSPTIFIKTVAFRPRLTTGLAFSDLS
jgi:hypothetical protein